MSNESTAVILAEIVQVRKELTDLSTDIKSIASRMNFAEQRWVAVDSKLSEIVGRQVEDRGKLEKVAQDVNAAWGDLKDHKLRINAHKDPDAVPKRGWFDVIPFLADLFSLLGHWQSIITIIAAMMTLILFALGAILQAGRWLENGGKNAATDGGYRLPVGILGYGAGRNSVPSFPVGPGVREVDQQRGGVPTVRDDRRHD